MSIKDIYFVLNLNNTNIYKMDYEDLVFEPLKEDFIKILYKDKIFKITTPTLRCPFGIKEFKYNKEDLLSRYSFSLSLDKINIDERNKKFYEFIKEFENSIYKFVKSKKEIYYQDLHKKKFPKAFSSKIYEKVGYSPLFNLDLKSDTKIYLSSEEEISYEDLLKKNLNNFYTSCEIICNGIWINDKKFGISWKVSKLFIKDIEKDDNEEKYINLVF
jgi:hypothetical protein